MNIIVAGVIFFSTLALASAQPAADAAGAPIPCGNSQSGHGVAIQSCSFTLESSPGGNANYFVNVTIEYKASSPTKAVRFRCTLSNASSKVTQFGVLRQSGSALKFVSPFVSSSSPLKSVACAVDAT